MGIMSQTPNSCDEEDHSYVVTDQKQLKKEAYLALKDLTRAFSLTFKNIAKKKELKEYPLRCVDKE